MSGNEITTLDGSPQRLHVIPAEDDDDNVGFKRGSQSRRDSPTAKDVLFGRGKGIQKHPGNRRLRRIVESHKAEYAKSSKSEKTLMSQEIVWTIRRHGGGFLRKDDVTGKYVDVGDKAAQDKVSHQLRHKKLASASASSSPTNINGGTNDIAEIMICAHMIRTQQKILRELIEDHEAGQLAINFALKARANEQSKK